jgi:hypothetical protein
METPKNNVSTLMTTVEEILESEFPASSKGKKKGASKRGNPLKCATKMKKYTNECNGTA